MPPSITAFMAGTGRKAQPFGRRALPWKDCPAFALRNLITPANLSGRQPDGGWATAQEAAYPPGLCSHCWFSSLQRPLHDYYPLRAAGDWRIGKCQASLERAAAGFIFQGFPGLPPC